MPYRCIEHTADVGIEVWGDTLEEVFVSSAQGMFAILVDVKRVKSEKREFVSVEGTDLEELLVRWLEELLFKWEVGGMAYKEFEVNLNTSECTIESWVVGGKYTDEMVRKEIKAVTYHNLDIKKEDGLWRCRIIFDV